MKFIIAQIVLVALMVTALWVAWLYICLTFGILSYLHFIQSGSGSPDGPTQDTHRDKVFGQSTSLSCVSSVCIFPNFHKPKLDAKSSKLPTTMALSLAPIRWLDR